MKIVYLNISKIMFTAVKPVILLVLLLIAVFTVSVMPLAAHDITVFNYTEFNWKISDLGPTHDGPPGSEESCGSPKIQSSIAPYKKMPSGSPPQFRSIPAGTADNPSSTNITWDYYCPSMIKLTVNPPSYMVGVSTNKLNLRSLQKFKLENDENGAEFELTPVWSNDKTELHVRKIRDYTK